METELTPMQKDLSSLMALKAEIDTVGLNCQQIKVMDISTLAVAQQNLSKAVNIAAEIETKRKAIKEPYLVGGKLIDSTAKTLTETLELGVKSIKSEIANWQRKLMTDAAEAKVKLDAEIAALTTNASDADLQVIESVVNEAKEKLDIDAAANKVKGIRWSWGFEVNDITDVPTKWLTIDPAKVKEWLIENKDKLTDGQVHLGLKFIKKMGVSA